MLLNVFEGQQGCEWRERKNFSGNQWGISFSMFLLIIKNTSSSATERYNFPLPSPGHHHQTRRQSHQEDRYSNAKEEMPSIRFYYGLAGQS